MMKGLSIILLARAAADAADISAINNKDTPNNNIDTRFQRALRWNWSFFNNNNDNDDIQEVEDIDDDLTMNNNDIVEEIPWAGGFVLGDTDPPSKRPSKFPTKQPTVRPTTLRPTTLRPTRRPTPQPSTSPPTTSSPTTSPPTTLTPTSSSPTPLQYCPPSYDITKTDYVTGELIESELYIFQCAIGPPNDINLYEQYCNMATLDTSLSQYEIQLWDTAWIPISECYRTLSPTTSPTYKPSFSPTEVHSSKPSIAISNEPSLASSQKPSVALSERPSIRESDSPSSYPSGHPTETPTFQPTLYPTISPSNNPSNAPTPLPYCPPAYDPNRTNYIAGDQVELMNHIHTCAGGRSQQEAQIYEPYCNIYHQSMLDQSNLQVELQLWNEAWTFTNACYKTDVPTTSPITDYPTISPTNNPTETGLWYPDLYVEEQRCVRGEGYPFWMSLSSNVNDYLFESREDCCSKHVCEETSRPTRKSSKSPTMKPSNIPSKKPSRMPSRHPSKHPSVSPSVIPTYLPTMSPSLDPTTDPSNSPSKPPTIKPTPEPTTSPSDSPIAKPTHKPSISPSQAPMNPTNEPTLEPSNTPTDVPTVKPTLEPSPKPTRRFINPQPTSPTKRPTTQPIPPTRNPTPRPTRLPTQMPTFDANFLNQFPYSYPYKRFTAWVNLDSIEKNTAQALGYFRTSWDNLEIYNLESLRFSDLTYTEQNNVLSLDMDEEMWDCWMNHYNGYYWEDMPNGKTQYLAVLGYTQTTWDEDLGADTDNFDWYELSSEQQNAANKLCYFANSWDWLDLNYW